MNHDNRHISGNLNTNAIVNISVFMLVFDGISGVFPVLSQPLVGSFSFFQIYRIGLIFVLFYLFMSMSSANRRRHAVSSMFIGLLVFAVAKEYLDRHYLNGFAVAAYLRIFVWLLWIKLLISIEHTEDSCSLMINAVKYTTMFIVIMVVACVFSGSSAIYDEDGFATSGGFRSGKSIAGPCAIGGLVWFYDAILKRSLVSCICGVGAFMAVLFSFNRSGQAGVLLAMAWLFLWSALLFRDNQQPGVAVKRSWLLLFFMVFFFMLSCLGLWYVNEYGLDGLKSRWSDVNTDDFQSAGSGRGMLWSVAWDWFCGADLFDKIFGIGYSGMIETNFKKLGNPFIHSHSDFFDLMFVGGFLGISTWFIVIIDFFRLGHKGYPLSSLQGGFAVAICIVFSVYSFLTSAFFGPLMMGYVILSIIAIGTRPAPRPPG